MRMQDRNKARKSLTGIRVAPVDAVRLGIDVSAQKLDADGGLPVVHARSR
jgi:hypothetical protein